MALFKIHPKSSHFPLPHCCCPPPGHHHLLPGLHQLLTVLSAFLQPLQSVLHSGSRVPLNMQTCPWLAFVFPTLLASGIPRKKSETSTRPLCAAPLSLGHLRTFARAAPPALDRSSQPATGLTPPLHPSLSPLSPPHLSDLLFVSSVTCLAPWLWYSLCLCSLSLSSLKYESPVSWHIGRCLEELMPPDCHDWTNE